MKAQYIKLLIDSSYDSMSCFNTSITEIKIYDYNNINIAQGCSATVSSIYTGDVVNHSASTLTDGNVSGYVGSGSAFWSHVKLGSLSAMNTINGSQWCKINLGSIKDVKNLDVTTFFGSGYGALKSYRISISSDDSTYKDVITVIDQSCPIAGNTLTKTLLFNIYKYLIKQNEQYYSVKDNQLTQLGIPTDDTQKEQWFNDYGVEDLKVVTATQTQNTVLGIDKSTLGSGKYFSIPFNVDYQSIIDID